MLAQLHIIRVGEVPSSNLGAPIKKPLLTRGFLRFGHCPDLWLVRPNRPFYAQCVPRGEARSGGEGQGALRGGGRVAEGGGMVAEGGGLERREGV